MLAPPPVASPRRDSAVLGCIPELGHGPAAEPGTGRRRHRPGRDGRRSFDGAVAGYRARHPDDIEIGAARRLLYIAVGPANYINV